MNLHIVVCAGIVPDPLQTLEPVTGPSGPGLKNEMLSRPLFWTPGQPARCMKPRTWPQRIQAARSGLSRLVRRPSCNR